MKADGMEKIIYITDNVNEMIEIGHKIVEVRSELYTPLMMEKIFEGARKNFTELNDDEIDKMVYRSIYDYWAYGNNVEEEYYYQFYKKNHAEKSEYLAGKLRTIYVHYLNNNPDGGCERINLLKDKYKLYKLLKPYYLRDVIELKDESDYQIFEEFTKKHNEFVVKPSDYGLGIGVHKASLSEYDNDIKKAFDSIMGEGVAITKRHPSHSARMVIEEIVVQDEAFNVFQKESVAVIRATAVRGKDGKIHILHPWIKIGFNGAFVSNMTYGFDAGIDPKTGIVFTDGYQENGNVYKTHPNSGIAIKGFRIPRWDELISLVDEIMAKLPDYGYIGWDLVLTPKGWCIMEGNYSGELAFQFIKGCGMRKEFEELIGWKFDKDFWWQHELYTK